MKACRVLPKTRYMLKECKEDWFLIAKLMCESKQKVYWRAKICLNCADM